MAQTTCNSQILNEVPSQGGDKNLREQITSTRVMAKLFSLSFSVGGKLQHTWQEKGGREEDIFGEKLLGPQTSQAFFFFQPTRI